MSLVNFFDFESVLPDTSTATPAFWGDTICMEYLFTFINWFCLWISNECLVDNIELDYVFILPTSFFWLEHLSFKCKLVTRRDFCLVVVYAFYMPGSLFGSFPALLSVFYVSCLFVMKCLHLFIISFLVYSIAIFFVWLPWGLHLKS